MRWWKILGLAGLAGVAATGAVTVHAERRRRAYTPDEIRARLHERVAESATTPVSAPAAARAATEAGAVPADGPAGTGHGRSRRLRAGLDRVGGLLGGRLRGRR